MIRETWLRKHDRYPDGRRIPELQGLNVSFKEIKLGTLRDLVKELELDLALNVNEPENIQLLLEILNLDQKYADRLSQVVKRGVDHNVLNARKHTEESQLIAGAGAFGAVMIATSMAGRGVDIKLGGELAEEITTDVVRVLSRAGHEDPYELSLDEQEGLLQQLKKEDYGIYDTEINYFLQHMKDKEQVKALGGLHVIGTERHEARRIDNQLRGRAARQGDPGSSRFYLSLEDELMARFGGQQMEALMTGNLLQVDESMPITYRLIDRVIEQSQNRVEGANFDVRKHLLEYDDVLNTQRAKIYQQRERIFSKRDLAEDILDMLGTEVQLRVDNTFWELENSGDSSQGWRLLGWLAQTQPTLTFQDQQVPTYALQLILDDIQEKASPVRKDQALPLLLEIGQKVLAAEETHILQAVDQILEDRQIRFQDQLDMRLETLGTFLEGMSYESEEPRNPQAIYNELRELVRIRFELTPGQIKELASGGGDDLHDELVSQVESHLKEIEFKRLLGAVERILGTSLDGDEIQFTELDWPSTAELLVEKVKAQFNKRREEYFTDPVEAKIKKGLESGIREIQGEELTDTDLVRLMGLMAEGRRTAFDKKSHKRIWLRTQRLRYTFYAAGLLLDMDHERVATEILQHLEKAYTKIQNAWGDNEIERLKEVSLSSLDEDFRTGIQAVIGEETYPNYIGIQIKQLPNDIVMVVEEELGRSALTNIYRELFLRVISELWVEYLTEMEALRVAIGLEAYAQRDPLVQYKNKGFEMFQNLMEDMRVGVVNRMFTFQPRDLSRIQAGVEETATSPGQA
jgi:preprotein translocase subunit SecA